VKLQIPDDFQGRVRYDEPMSAHTSWRVGGPAEVFFTPHDVSDLASFLRALPAEAAVYWVGLGTNLLVREGGIRGVVIATPGAFTRIDRRAQTRIYCEASVPCARIARACANWGLAQGEFFGGIPGTLGGALAMNAGAYGEETWNHVVTVETIDRRGRRRSRRAQEFQVGYRQVAAAGEAERGPVAQEWFVSAELQFEPRGPEHTASMRALAEQRAQAQPLGEWSCGSVFKNPPGDHAARLIEAAGLKGHRIGDAVVSEKHANFIINMGHASAADLERLIMHVRATVERLYGIVLEPEVRIIGEGAPAALSLAGGGG
jgi:UDP-N-acetylmuramate dehydrogenase